MHCSQCGQKASSYSSTCPECGHRTFRPHPKYQAICYPDKIAWYLMWTIIIGLMSWQWAILNHLVSWSMDRVGIYITSNYNEQAQSIE